MKVLFLNHKKENCGVQQYGLRIYNIIRKSTNYIYIYAEVENANEFNNILKQCDDVIAVIYNYCSGTMDWLNSNTVAKGKKNIGIIHEWTSDRFQQASSYFDAVCNIDPTVGECGKHYSLPRPIFEDINLSHIPSTKTIREFIEYNEGPEVPIFGSFGFGFPNKGHARVIEFIEQRFDRAIIKFVMPEAFFDGNKNRTNSDTVARCHQQNKKKGVKLMITHEFFTEDDILKFLSSNTMNIFLYDDLPGNGISSTIDYALSVKRPLGISTSHMFKHILSKEVCLYWSSVEYCMDKSVEWCNQFLDKYSHENMISKIDHVVDKLVL